MILTAAVLIVLQATAHPTLERQSSGTTHRLQAVSVVNERVVWVSGVAGTWGLTTDGGASWKTAAVAGADSLEFRDVHGIDERTAYVLAAGPGARSRIYHTTDGGATWQLQFRNADTLAFYDCFAFWTPRAGLAFSDGVRGVFPLLLTADAGRSWRAGDVQPPANDGEGGFAASGTCVTTFGDSLAWIATGAGPVARVLHSRDRGASWRAVVTPMAHGKPTAGHTGIAFRTARDGIAVGGDIADSLTIGPNYVILTRDGGATWTLGGRLPFSGAAYGVVFVPGGGAAAVAVGPRGAGWTRDGGQSWQPLDTLSHWSVGFASPGAGWMVGPAGRVTKITLP